MDPTKELDLEEAIKEVEKIIKELERKDLNLEEAIDLFEKGMELIHFCEKKLKEARLRVDVILRKGESFERKPLETAKEQFKDVTNS